MAKLISSPNKIRLNPPKFNIPENEPIWESHINGGMVTALDPQNLDNSQSPNVKNMVVRFDKPVRRNGTKLFTPLKPDSNKILGWFLYEKSDGSEKIIRLTKSSIYAASSGAWAALTGPALTGIDTDYWRTTILEDRMFASNNGADVIQEINIITNTYAPLGDAAKYRYITGFGDRVVGFYLMGGAPVGNQLGWCGNRNYAEWNPLIDQSAGSKVLATSSSDVSDFGSGIFSFGSVLVLIRDRSIWEATLQPIAQDPFNTYQKIPNVGSDSPNSIAKTAAGVVFADTRTRNVYLYGLGGVLNAIGDQVKFSIFTSSVDPSLLVGSYNHNSNEYSLAKASNVSSLVQEWIYNFDSKVWTFSEYDSISLITSLDFAGGGITIDELVGTIDSLVGTIDSMSPGPSVTKFYGKTTGELLYENSQMDTDNLVAYTSELRSKDFTLPAKNRTINRLHIEYVPLLAGNITISYSKDSGITWNFYKTIVTGNLDVGKYKEVVCVKNIQTRRYMFKIESTAGLLEVIKYAIYGDEAGESKNA